MTKNTKSGTMPHLLFLSIVSILISGYSSCDKAESPAPGTQHNTDTLLTSTNPVGNITDIGDPYILKHGGKYYIYATSSGEGFFVWVSSILVDWVQSGLALNRNTEGNKWGKGNFWAPEVKYYEGKFYMTSQTNFPLLTVFR
jgi:beta-xylosidase